MSVRVSDMLFDENGKGFVVVDVSEPDDPFLTPTVTVCTSDGLKRLVTNPRDMFHFKPVKCADGRVLRSGQIVWPLYRDDGPFVVNMIIGRTVSCYELDDPDNGIHISPDGLVHYKSVVDANGIRIDKGDTVCSLVRGNEYEVLDVSYPDGCLTMLDKETGERVHASASIVTHVFLDSWERIEEDAAKTTTKYWGVPGGRMRPLPGQGRRREAVGALRNPWRLQQGQRSAPRAPRQGAGGGGVLPELRSEGDIR